VLLAVVQIFCSLEVFPSLEASLTKGKLAILIHFIFFCSDYCDGLSRVSVMDYLRLATQWMM